MLRCRRRSSGRKGPRGGIDVGVDVRALMRRDELLALGDAGFRCRSLNGLGIKPGLGTSCSCSSAPRGFLLLLLCPAVIAMSHRGPPPLPLGHYLPQDAHPALEVVHEPLDVLPDPAAAAAAAAL